MQFLRIGLTIIALSLTACATMSGGGISSSNWKGAKIQSIIDHMGTPDQVLHEPGGNTLYVYMTHAPNTFNAPPLSYTPVLVVGHNKTIGIPEPAQPNQNREVSNCAVTFTTNRQGIIISTAQQGYCENMLNLSAPAAEHS